MKKDFRSISRMYRDMQEAAIPKKAEKAVEKSLDSIDDPVEKLEALDGMVKKALGESDAYYAMKRAEKHAAKDGHDFHKLPEYDRGADKPHKEKYRAMAQKESLEFGTTQARDTYASDTPGQTTGDPAHEPEHARKTKFGLSVDGIPKKGGEMVKPDNDVTTGLKVEGTGTEAELVDEAKEMKEWAWDHETIDIRSPEKKEADKKAKMAKAADYNRKREKKYNSGLKKVSEAMSVTLRKSKSQPGSYKVHSVGSQMKKHGGIKPGERVKDHEIDGLHDSQIKVKYHKEMTEHQKGLIEAKYSDKQVRMAKGIAFDKRHYQGDYSGAAKKMEKIKKGLSDHPKAKDALRRANEQKEFAKGLFGESMTPNSHGYNVQQHAGELAKKDGKDIKKLPYGHAQGYRDKASAALKKNEAVERRADAKVIMVTDPNTGKRVAKKAPRREIEIGLGKDA